MYRLIHIEPDAATHRAVVEVLTQGPYPFTVEHVSELGQAPPVAEPETVDAVLLAGFAGGPILDELRRCRGWFSTRPIIVLTETPGMTFAQEMLRAGAHDVVLEQERALAVLARIVLYAIERATAERNQARLRVEACGLRALLDTLVDNPFDSILQTDAEGVIERASPIAVELLGLDAKALTGLHIEERVHGSHRARLGAFLELTATSASPLSMSFAFLAGEHTRLLDVEPIPLGVELVDAPRLFRLSEFAADFAAEPSTTPAKAAVNAEPAAAAAAETPVSAAHVPVGKSLGLLGQLAKSVVWRCVLSSPTASGRYGFLCPDPRSAEALAGLARHSGDNPDFTLALDRLHLAAWIDLAASDAIGSRHRLVFEISYATFTSHSHLERLRIELAEAPAELGGRFIFLLRHVPSGIHVPSLAKVTRNLAAEHARPGLKLADLEHDYRLLPFDHLALLTLDFRDLKRAIAADAKALSSFLRRVRSEGALVAIRGAAGPLAEKLRQRLPVDLTVEA